MASCERHEPSFVRKSLSALPGILLLTGVAVFSWFITPRLIALHPFMKSLNLSDFIVAIILGMVIGLLDALPVLGTGTVFVPWALVLGGPLLHWCGC